MPAKIKMLDEKASQLGFENFVAYCNAKFGVPMQTMAKELGVNYRVVIDALRDIQKDLPAMTLEEFKKLVGQ